MALMVSALVLMTLALMGVGLLVQFISKNKADAQKRLNASRDTNLGKNCGEIWAQNLKGSLLKTNSIDFATFACQAAGGPFVADPADSTCSHSCKTADSGSADKANRLYIISTLKNGTKSSSGVRLTVPCDPSATDPSGFGIGSALNPYQICTVAQLDNIRSGYPNKFFILKNDLDLSSLGTNFHTLNFSASTEASGFDGGGFTISNLSMGSPVNSAGGPINGSLGFSWAGRSSFTIKNLTLSNVIMSAPPATYATVGAFVSGVHMMADDQSVVTVNNCHLTGTNVLAGTNVGGLLGVVQGFNIVNSTVGGNTQIQHSGAAQGGGLLGGLVASGGNYKTGDASISGSSVLVSMTNLPASYMTAVGGLIATFHGNNGDNRGTTPTIFRSLNITSSHSQANISFTGASGNGLGRAGGLVGYADGNVVMNSSFWNGTVTEPPTWGGLIGGMTWGSLSITLSYSLGDVTKLINNAPTTGHAQGWCTIGGLVGSVSNGNSGSTTISKSFSKGLLNVPACKLVGGLIGFGSYNQYYIDDSYVTSSITGHNEGSSTTSVQPGSVAPFIGLWMSSSGSGGGELCRIRSSYAAPSSFSSNCAGRCARPVAGDQTFNRDPQPLGYKVCTYGNGNPVVPSTFYDSTLFPPPPSTNLPNAMPLASDALNLGKTTPQLKINSSQLSGSIFSGWNFTTIWKVPDSPAPAAYPCLRGTPGC